MPACGEKIDAYAGFESAVPTVLLDADYAAEPVGQAIQAMEGFLEEHGWMRGQVVPTAPQPVQAEKQRGSFYAGVDSGTELTKVLIVNGQKEVIGQACVPTESKVDMSAKKALGAALQQAGVAPPELKYIVATGCGRNALRWPNKDVTEIVCQARGAFEQFPQARTVIDISGQDIKVISIDETGNVVEFLMNDKCATGTGSFLVMMADTLGVDMEKFTALGQSWNEEVNISGTCAVFIKNEVETLVAQGKALADIIHGLNGSVANRMINMIGRLGGDGAYVLTGGVARNNGIAAELANRLGEEILRPAEPEFCGAYGAALIAMD